ncbi:MAG TPA: hypothetical protein VGO62_01015 [Myxococcota bacterium]
MAPRSALVSLVTLTLFLLGACRSVSPPPLATPATPAAPAAPDEDAPAHEAWSARHARGTRVHVATAAVDDLSDLAVRGDRFEVPTRGGRIVRSYLVRGDAGADAAPSDGGAPAIVLVRARGAWAGDVALERDALTTPIALALARTGAVVAVPDLLDRDDAFSAVDDVIAVARALATDPDVDADQIYAFGSGRITCQLALDQRTPFRAIGALGATTAHALAADPALADDVDERVARALLPHAGEVATRLVIYAPVLDPAARAVHARNVAIELDSSDPLRAFTALVQAVPRASLASSRSAP